MFLFEYIHALNEWPPFSPINDHLLICTQYLFGEGFIFALRLRASLYDPFFFLKTEGFTKRPPSLYSPHQMIPLFFLCPHWKTPFFLYIACHRKTPTLRVLSAHPRHFHMWVPPRGSEKAPFTISALKRRQLGGELRLLTPTKGLCTLDPRGTFAP